MKLGFSTWAMPKVPIDEALDGIAALGYTGVEITVHIGWVTDVARLGAEERRHIREKVSELGLELPAITCPGQLVGEPATVEASIQRVKQAMDLAVEWADQSGPPYVVTIPGGTIEDWDDGARRDQLARSTRDLVRHAEERGVTFAVEAHVNQIVDRPDRQLWQLEQAPSPAHRVNFDISHFDVLGIPTEDSVMALVPNGRSVHTHLKDQRGVAPNHQFLIPGEGDFDYVRYLRAMRDAGYDGYIMPEISMMVQRRPDYDPFAAARQSFETLDRAFKDAGVSRE